MKPTRPNYEPPILRTHRLITKGIPAHAGDVIMLSAAESLQALAAQPLPCKEAPTRRSVHELLSTASHIAKAFAPLAMEHGTATLNQEAA